MTTIAYITGDTFRFREQIKGARDRLTRGPAYSWDAGRKAWMRTYESEVTAERVISDVRSISGIGNRGSFDAEVVAS